MAQVLKNDDARRHVRDQSVCNTYTIPLVHILCILHIHWYTYYTYYKYYTHTDTRNTTCTPVHILQIHRNTGTHTTDTQEHIPQIHTSMSELIVDLMF